MQLCIYEYKLPMVRKRAMFSPPAILVCAYLGLSVYPKMSLTRLTVFDEALLQADCGSVLVLSKDTVVRLSFHRRTFHEYTFDE